MWNDQHGVSVALDVRLEESGNISLALTQFDETPSSAAAAMNASVTLCTNGTWVIGSTVGSGLNLTVGSWQRVELSRLGGSLSASVGGELLANTSIPSPAAGNFSLRLMLSHYFVAAVDNLVVKPQPPAPVPQ